MKISCLQENLHRALSIVSRGIGRDSSLPILTNVLLKVENGMITLSSTNLEIGVHTIVRGKIESEGVIAIDGKILADYVGLLPKEKVDIELENEGILSLNCQNYTTKIRGVNADDFPIIPAVDRNEVISCSVEEFRKALHGTVFTVSVQDSRPELGGILFQFRKDDNTLALVGTDAYRLAKRMCAVESNLQSDRDIIIPMRTLQELLHILGGEMQGRVEMYLSDNQVLFLCEGVELLSKVIQGTFPEYEQIIPSSFPTLVTVDVREFIKAVKVSSIFSKSGLYDVGLSLRCMEGGTGVIVVSAANTTVGENTTTIPILWNGSENEVTLNYRYLLEGLQSFDYDQVQFGVVDGSNPCILKPLENKNILYLIMPIRE